MQGLIMNVTHQEHSEIQKEAAKYPPNTHPHWGSEVSNIIGEDIPEWIRNLARGMPTLMVPGKSVQPRFELIEVSADDWQEIVQGAMKGVRLERAKSRLL